MNELSQFHFLRPHVLWLLIPAALMCLGLARTIINSGQLQRVIDPDLLPHLLLRGGERRPWLFSLIFALLALMILALAGPTWRKLPTPVFSSQDALVILLDLSPSMMATDLTPNRLTRARLKILDILRQREDGLTALVAFGGEAHVVTPLTEDTATIANLVPALSPTIMPVPGSNIEMAVETGLRLLEDGANGRGQLLAVTDGIAKEALPTVAGMVAGDQVELSILAVGSGEGSPIPQGDGGGFVTDSNGAIVIAGFDAAQLQKLASGSGGRFARIAVDDKDIAKLLPAESPPDQARLTEREFDQWREEGPWLLLLLLPLAALLFRRGALACALPLSFTLLLPEPVHAVELQDLWLREDQQAKRLLEEGKAGEAAEKFRDPQWRGTAQYRAGDFPAAQKDFSQSETADSLYNLGNALTHQGRYDEAIEAFDAALDRQPQLTDAQHNREIAKQLRDLQKQQQQQQSQQGQDQQQQEEQQGQQDQQQSQSGQQQQDQSDQQQDQQNQGAGQNDQGEPEDSGEQQADSGDQQENAEEEQQSGKPKDGEEQEKNGAEQQAGARESELDPETQQALDQWLRQIPDDPAGLMREKFKYESLQRRRAYRTGEWEPPENGATQRW
ncbi:Tetratricopeptide repeat protein [Microbulbifer aggregans]|uniref:Tetratricopeptide repeat protein n=1 Tax=Microbulbifer aggregans TaxID=1769779 RepID=A0A1C9W9J3_9GAMM|nr:VWA domain-containing protein [Microbulbifer aggregans]AOS97773.1 Tetratricopeptide repeat protein [Microbulbifer aggregans]